MNSHAGAVARRLERVRAELAELDLEGLLVSRLPNVRYLTGFSGSNAWLLIDATGATLLTDGRYGQQAEEELPRGAGFEFLIAPDGVLGELVVEQAKRQSSGSRFGFEGRHLSFAEWERLRDVSLAVEWVAVSGLVEGVRAVKEEEEIAAIETAARIAATALAETVTLVEPGVREADIASELDYRMRRLGAQRPAFETIIASGARSALPHAATSDRSVREGEFILCDFGAHWRGYCSDMTRTFVVGEAETKQREVYELVLAAQSAARSALRAGVSGAEVDAMARQVFAEADVEERFVHSTGHGLGLEVHEDPRLGRRSEDRLESNMVVTVEPGLYFPGWGGVRIEDALVVTEDGPRALVDLEASELQALPL
ncbi:MAG: aminopeptidase P family protein [Gemmatimonadota bacterium]|nr:MAG: aminopeptidase P family protein [Gemmatimonadota bacterium]